MAHHILIIEDESLISETLQLNLELEGYQTTVCNNGILAVSMIKQTQPDLILLDIMLPHKNGIDIFEETRKENIHTPVIFLTAKNNLQDKIKGLKLGAEDYITKPFELEELLLRVRNVLKRLPLTEYVEAVFKFGKCEINFSTFEVKTIGGKTETLSKREIAFLKLLTQNSNKVISRDQVLEALWLITENPSARTIDNYILNFRKLFEINPKEPIHFLSIRGVGYKFYYEQNT